MLGGGAAGLAAAHELSRRGHRVTLLEARPRLGGRILTLSDPSWPLPVELGAEFLHGPAEPARRMAEAAGAAVVDLPDVHVWAGSGRLHASSPAWKALLRLMRGAQRRRRDVSFAEHLAAGRASPEVKRTGRLFVEGYYAARIDRISARWLASGSEGEETNRQYRLERGYGEIVSWLGRSLDAQGASLRLGTVATEVEWARGRVRVQARSAATGRKLEAIPGRAVVVTLPLGVLKAAPGAPGAVRFQPTVPGLTGALERIEAGPVRKLLLRFRRAFWDEPGFLERRLPRSARARARQVSFLHDAQGAFPTWWLPVPRRVPVLTAWAGGPAAEALAGLDQRALLDRALDALSRLLAVPRRGLDEQLEGWLEHDWQADPFSRGAYGYVAVDGLPAVQRRRRPVQDALFFAGEATEPDEMGTVSGAIASGLRAARQVEEAT